MPNVVRFALSSARTLYVRGLGAFRSGILDVDANDLDAVSRARYLVRPYGAIELGTVDSATALPSLPAVPGPPNPDPYPQYPTMDEIVASTELRAAFGLPARAGELLARLKPANAKPIPSVSTLTPTITYTKNGTTLTTRRCSPISPHVANLGHMPDYSATFGNYFNDDRAGSGIGLDFIHTGTAVEWGVSFNNNPAELRVWIWVDGEPLTAAPIAPWATPAGGDLGSCKLDFGSFGTRRITVWGGHVRSWSPIGMAATDTITEAPRLPRIGVVMDSFGAGSSGTPMALDLPPIVAGFHLGAEVVNGGWGGTGYTTGQNTYGSAFRIGWVGEAGPLDALVFVGSVNDGDAATLTAAATQCFADYAAAYPGLPVIVFGPQATNATDTTSAARTSATAKLKAACDASPNVIAFYDMIGLSDGLPAAWINGVARNRGARVRHLGAVWEWAGSDGDNWGTPGVDHQWLQVTWDYWGSGRVGATTGVGTRDILLYSDSVHPTTAASLLLGRRIASGVRLALRNFAAA